MQVADRSLVADVTDDGQIQLGMERSCMPLFIICSKKAFLDKRFKYRHSKYTQFVTLN